MLRRGAGAPYSAAHGHACGMGRFTPCGAVEPEQGVNREEHRPRCRDHCSRGVVGTRRQSSLSCCYGVVDTMKSRDDGCPFFREICSLTIALLLRLCLAGIIFVTPVGAPNAGDGSASAGDIQSSSPKIVESQNQEEPEPPIHDWSRYAELVALILFGITISTLIFILFRHAMITKPEIAIRGAALILIVSSTAIIVITGNIDKAGPVIGLYGAVVGYLLARPDSNGKTRDSSSDASDNSDDTQTPNSKDC